MATTDLKTTKDEKKIKAIQDDVKEMVDSTDAIKITDEEGMITANNFLGEIKTAINEIKEFKEARIKPFKAFTKWWDGEFKRVSEPLEAAEKRLKDAMGAFADKQAEEAEKERKEAEEAAAKVEEEAKKAEEAGDTAGAEAAREEASTAVQTVEAPQTSFKSGGGTTSMKRIWTYEIEDETKIPRKFMKVDLGALKKAVDGGDREIKGLKIFQKTSVSHRV